jgi:sodium pump decarboxylase gamma subunit
MNPDTVVQGLAITLAGMALVFLALGLIVLAMYLMGRYLQPQQPARSGAEERASVAAMAAAIVLAADKAENQHASAWNTLEQDEAPGAWQIAHRIRRLTPER